MIDFIHVGDYKTGTSWMQKYFYPLHPEINYLGGPFDKKALERLFHELIDSRDLDFNREALSQKIRSTLTGDTKPGLKGICREVISGSDFISIDNSRQNALRLQMIFGEVKIIYIIREQTSMLKSIYSQYVKIGGTLSFNDFLFDPIFSKGLFERLAWHKQISMYKEIFGEQNVHIGLYEEFKYQKDTFLAKICEFLNIQPFFPAEKQVIVNRGLTKYGLFAARIINHFFRTYYNNGLSNRLLTSFLKTIMPAKTINTILEDASLRILSSHSDYGKAQLLKYAVNKWGVEKGIHLSEKLSIGGPLQINKSYEIYIKEFFKESNRLLVNRYSLEIKKYGYLD